MNLKQIKDAARKAFSDQQSQDTEGGVPDGVSFIAGFLAGARHIQQELLLYKEAARSEAEFVNELKEDNKKLVNALKLFAFPEGKLEHEDVERVSRQVLKEIGEE